MSYTYFYSNDNRLRYLIKAMKILQTSRSSMQNSTKSLLYLIALMGISTIGNPLVNLLLMLGQHIAQIRLRRLHQLAISLRVTSV